MEAVFSSRTNLFVASLHHVSIATAPPGPLTGPHPHSPPVPPTPAQPRAACIWWGGRDRVCASHVHPGSIAPKPELSGWAEHAWGAGRVPTHHLP